MRIAHRTGLRPGRRTPLLVAVALAALLAVHLGLAGILITHWHWSLTALGATAAAKLLLVTGYRFRHRLPPRTASRSGGLPDNHDGRIPK